MRFRLPVAGLATALVLTMPALSQAQAPAKSQFGVIAGVSLGNVTGSDTDQIGNTANRTGFLAGLMANFALGNILNIRPEAFYIQKGVKESGTDFSIKLDYIEVPVLLVGTIPMAGNVKPEIFAGPQVSFRVGCSFSGGGSSVSCNDAGAELTSVNYGVVFGAAVRIAAFLVSVQYDLGLNTVDAETDPDDIKLTALMFKLGYFFK